MVGNMKCTLALERVHYSRVYKVNGNLESKYYSKHSMERVHFWKDEKNGPNKCAHHCTMLWCMHGMINSTEVASSMIISAANPVSVSISGLNTCTLLLHAQSEWMTWTSATRTHTIFQILAIYTLLRDLHSQLLWQIENCSGKSHFLTQKCTY